MTAFPRDSHGLIRRADALAADISDDQLRAAVRANDLLRLTPGVFVESGEQFDGPSGRDLLYRLRSIAVATSSEDRTMPLSHTSAAAMHRLPLLHPDRRHVHLTNGLGVGGRIRAGRHVHSALLESGEVVRIDGVATTSLERTAVDVATMGQFAQALTAFDAALRAGADGAAMAEALERCRFGTRAATRALPLADPGAESVGESWSRAQMIDAGMPIPRLQAVFRCRGQVYRSDFFWEEQRLIGEFDGIVKYGRLLRPGESVADAVLREKRREDALRSVGFMVVRWTWDDLRARRVVDIVRPWLSRAG